MILLYVDIAQLVRNKINQYLDTNPDYATLRSQSLSIDNVIPVYECVICDLEVFCDKAIGVVEAEFREKMTYVRTSSDREKLKLEKNQKQANINSDYQFLLEEAKQITNYYLITMLSKKMPNSLSLQEKTALQAIAVAMGDYWETQIRLKAAKVNLSLLENELNTEILSLQSNQQKLEDLRSKISIRYDIHAQLELEINAIQRSFASQKVINRNLLIVGTAVLLLTVALFTLPELIVSGVIASILAWSVPLLITGPTALTLLISSLVLAVKSRVQEKELTQRITKLNQNNTDISHYESECSTLQYNLIPAVQLRMNKCKILIEKNHDLRERLEKEAKESLKKAQKITTLSPEKQQSKFIAPKRIGSARVLLFSSDATCSKIDTNPLATPLKFS